MNCADARIMLAAATAEFDEADALRQMAAGIDQLEQARGALRAGLHRSLLIARHAQVYEIALGTLARLRPDNPQAGWLAAQLCESLSRSALAQTLREGQLGISDQGRLLLAAIGRLEASGGGAQVGPHGELARLRAELQTVLSATFATAYLPQPVDFGQLRRRLGSAHALSYRVHEASPNVLRGHVTWTPPGSAAPQIAGFCLDDPDLLALIGLPELHEREKQMVASGFSGAKSLWSGLGTALLPPGLRTALQRSSTGDPEHIVLVPDGHLALLPWAAILLDDGRSWLRRPACSTCRRSTCSRRNSTGIRRPARWRSTWILRFRRTRRSNFSRLLTRSCRWPALTSCERTWRLGTWRALTSLLTATALAFGST